MRTRRLTTYNLPDLGDHLIHFTGRNGPKADDVDSAIKDLSGQKRLAKILEEGVIRGFETFGGSAPVVCLTESVKESVTSLIAEGRYEPCGVGFSKQFIFDKQGGPALYVRGDEWETATSALPEPLRARLVRFWPGAEAEPGEDLPWYLQSKSEWLHEREWRVAGELRFCLADVKFLIFPDLDWHDSYAEWVEERWGPEPAAVFQAIPSVVMNPDGHVIRDDTGIWA
jgi:hypothetical protein